MIKNQHQHQHQHRVVEGQVARLEEALERAKLANTDLRPALHQAMIAGLEAQIDELQQELEEYASPGS
jgi:hypothetical protein